MKKRLVTIVIGVTLVLICNGCSSEKVENESRGVDYFTMPAPIETTATDIVAEDTKDEETVLEEVTVAETTSEEVFVGDGKGKVTDNSYINEAFGIEFILPSGFEFISEEEMSATGNSYEMWIGSSTNTSNMHIQNEYVPADVDIVEMMEENFDDWAQSMKSAFNGATCDIENVGKVTFLNNWANLVKSVIYSDARTVYQEMYMLHKGDRSLIITITVPEDCMEEMDNIKNGFKASK